MVDIRKIIRYNYPYVDKNDRYIEKIAALNNDEGQHVADSINDDLNDDYWNDILSCYDYLVDMDSYAEERKYRLEKHVGVASAECLAYIELGSDSYSSFVEYGIDIIEAGCPEIDDTAFQKAIDAVKDDAMSIIPDCKAYETEEYFEEHSYRYINIADAMSGVGVKADENWLPSALKNLNAKKDGNNYVFDGVTLCKKDGGYSLILENADVETCATFAKVKRYIDTFASMFA
jgi:hypothetical protein